MRRSGGPGLATSFDWTQRWPTWGWRTQVPRRPAMRVCAGEAGSTISAIGRVRSASPDRVRARSWQNWRIVVTWWSPSWSTSKREKSVAATPLGVDYLVHQRAAARAIEDELRPNSGCDVHCVQFVAGRVGRRGRVAAPRLPSSLIEHLTRTGLTVRHDGVQTMWQASSSATGPGFGHGHRPSFLGRRAPTGPTTRPVSLL